MIGCLRGTSGTIKGCDWLFLSQGGNTLGGWLMLLNFVYSLCIMCFSDKFAFNQPNVLKLLTIFVLLSKKSITISITIFLSSTPRLTLIMMCVFLYLSLSLSLSLSLCVG